MHTKRASVVRIEGWQAVGISEDSPDRNFAIYCILSTILANDQSNRQRIKTNVLMGDRGKHSQHIIHTLLLQNEQVSHGKYRAKLVRQGRLATAIWYQVYFAKKLWDTEYSLYSCLSYLWGTCFKTLNGYLKLWKISNPCFSLMQT